ncbi:MAG: hypothetical protein JKY37_01860 [Nannocystaceae bacterium]|nr:hypothetical protein [Nannocystaceae bacterium]
MLSPSTKNSRSATRASLAAALAGFFVLAGPTTPATASDSLSTPITTEMADVTWPVRVQVEIVPIAEGTPAQAQPLDAPGDEASGSSEEAPLPKRSVVVPDGHRLEFNSSVRSDAGRLDFELRVVPRIHPHGTVELEWDLIVSEAKFRPMGVGGYVAHRLQLAGEPELGPSTLSIARSDIVSTTGDVFVEEVEVNGQSFEIRILAESLRG